MRSFRHGRKRELDRIWTVDGAGRGSDDHQKVYGVLLDTAEKSGGSGFTHRRNAGSSRVPSEPLDPGKTSVVGTDNLGHPWSAISFDCYVGGNPRVDDNTDKIR